ncbi:PRC-barrel domain containing protein [Burkholderia glumae]|nr:photosystem reaction center subunit H [Burkholderia glumae]RQZ70403.1 PRC-barrel domain containing protein [Burkholderia glumae]UVS92103.1 PRC-barrel domain containing protein [Burkholderia glumae]
MRLNTIPRELTMQSTSPAAAGAARHAGRALMPARLFDGALARATDGYTLGFVSEVVLDLRTGRVAYALLALDERVHARLLTAVPWHYVALDADGTGLRIALSAATVRGAPAIDLDSWQVATDPAWESAVIQHYDTQDAPREYSLAEELGLRSPVRPRGPA